MGEEEKIIERAVNKRLDRKGRKIEDIMHKHFSELVDELEQELCVQKYNDVYSLIGQKRKELKEEMDIKDRLRKEIEENIVNEIADDGRMI